MWYVIQTVNGQEQQVCTWINQRMDHTLFERCFVPLYEDVWRKEGVGHISVKKTFAGYVFIKSDQPEAVYEELRKIPRFVNLLSDQPDQKKQKEKTFIPVSAEEEQFLSSIYTDGIMRVSYIEKIRKEESPALLVRWNNIRIISLSWIFPIGELWRKFPFLDRYGE